MIRILNLEKEAFPSSLLLKRKSIVNKTKMLMKNLEAGNQLKSRFCLIILKKIFHLGLKEIRLNFTVILPKVYYQIKK